MDTAKTDGVANTETLVVMKTASGRNDDIQWFDYVTGYFAPQTRVEWDAGTMFAALPSDIASFLLSRGYARPMTDAEIEAYTAPPKAEATPEPSVPPQKSRKKGEQS